MSLSLTLLGILLNKIYNNAVVISRNIHLSTSFEATQTMESSLESTQIDSGILHKQTLKINPSQNCNRFEIYIPLKTHALPHSIDKS